MGFTPPERQTAAEEPAPRAEPPRNLEFRGVYELAGTVKVNIHDSDRGEGRWVRLNDNEADFLVTDFSEENDQVTLEKEGEVARLKLDSSRESPGAPDGTPAEADPARPTAPQSAVARREGQGPPSTEHPPTRPPSAPEPAAPRGPEAGDEQGDTQPPVHQPPEPPQPTPQSPEGEAPSGEAHGPSPTPQGNDALPPLPSPSPEPGTVPEAEAGQETPDPAAPRRPVRRVVVPRR